MSHILIVGLKTKAFANYIETHGHTYTLLQDIRKTAFPDKKFKHRVVVNFDDRKALLNRIDRLKKRPDAVVSTYENYILPTAWIAEHFGLPGISVESATACTDKELMRTAFANASEKISPDFAVITDEDSLLQFADSHEYPLIIKPASLAKSLLVTKSNNRAELLDNYRSSLALLSSTYKSYGSSRTPKLLVEEFLAGSIHSVDAFVDSSGTPHVLDQVVDYKTGYDVGYNDNFHYSRTLPSALSPSDLQAVRHCAKVGIVALGIKNSPAHVEVILTQAGARIVEVGARNGGYRERMHRIANNIDITGATLSTALDQPISIAASRNDCCTVIELFPHVNGKFDSVEHLEVITQLASFHSLSIKAKPNEKVGLSKDGFRACGYIVLHHADREQFDRDFEFIKNNVHVKTHQ
jgi:ATP-grasp domain